MTRVDRILPDLMGGPTPGVRLPVRPEAVVTVDGLEYSRRTYAVGPVVAHGWVLRELDDREAAVVMWRWLLQAAGTWTMRSDAPPTREPATELKPS